jgi:hypothetical protein
MFEVQSASSGNLPQPIPYSNISPIIGKLMVDGGVAISPLNSWHPHAEAKGKLSCPGL